jgi:SH3-like domain-containing protein
MKKVELMFRKVLMTAALFAAPFVFTITHDAAPVQAQRYDCAHGPDTYRVRNVESWDVLNMRSGPSSSRRIVGEIDPYGSGIHCLGPCKGRWCRVSWRGIKGWVNMRYLGE